jgi:hypothetical protein
MQSPGSLRRTRREAHKFEHPHQTEQDRIPRFEDDVEHTRQCAE